MYIESVPNRNSPPAILLRESYREAGKVRKRTLANLSQWPSKIVEGLRALLKGGHVVSDLSEAFQVQRTRPHGHVAAVLGTLRHLGLERFLATRDSLERRLVVALIVARILEPRSKLALPFTRNPMQDNTQHTRRSEKQVMCLDLPVRTLRTGAGGVNNPALSTHDPGAHPGCVLGILRCAPPVAPPHPAARAGSSVFFA